MTSHWSKHLIFVGSGATASLGFKTTGSLGDYLYQVLKGDYEKAFKGTTVDNQEYVKSLLTDTSKHPWFTKVYNYKALKLCMKRIRQGTTVPLMELYNFIDMHIVSQRGLTIENQMLRADEFIQARRLLDNLILYRHQLDYNEMLNDEKKLATYAQYQKFAEFLGKEMQTEGLQLSKQGIEYRKRAFYLFNYSIISMNWDPMFIWILFNAHKKLNSKPPYIGDPARPLRLYHDFAHNMYMRKITDKNYDPLTWFPMNEGAAYRLNDSRGSGKEYIRLGKFYFPHGSHVFRKCENCGKLNIYLGDEWSYTSKTLYPPSIFEKNTTHRYYSKIEEAARKSSPDALTCVHCNEMTYTYNTDMVMQTSFKGNHSAYLEEMQRDMTVAVEKSEHIILLGYSLPKDDVIYNSVLAAKHDMNRKLTIIGSGKKAANAGPWVQGADNIKNVFSEEDAVFQTYLNVEHLFKPENIRIYTGRIPDVFTENGEFSAKKARAIFNWSTTY